MLLQDPGNLLTGSANGYVGGQIYFDAFNVSLYIHASFSRLMHP